MVRETLMPEASREIPDGDGDGAENDGAEDGEAGGSELVFCFSSFRDGPK